MSIRSTLRDAFESSSSSSLAELLEANGFAGVAPADMGEALLHYAEVAPLAEAEALAPLVTSHHSRQHQLDGGSDELQLSAELPSLEAETFEKLEVGDPTADIDSHDDFDIDAEDELDNNDPDALDLDGSFGEPTVAGNPGALETLTEERFGEGSAEPNGDDTASSFERVENLDVSARPVWVSSDADDLDALPVEDVLGKEFPAGEHQIDTEPDVDTEIDVD